MSRTDIPGDPAVPAAASSRPAGTAPELSWRRLTALAARIPPVAWTVTTGIAGVLTVVWITRHAWGPHVIAGGDVTADLVRTNYGIAHLLLHGRLDGWFPRFMLGHEEFLFNGPGVTWAVAVVRGLTFGQLSTTGGVKVVAIAALAAQPPAAAYLARSLGLDRLGAGLAGLLSLTATVGFGLGLEGMFVNGLLSHQVGAIAFFVTFGAALRAYDDPTRRRCIGAGVAAALLAMTHLISVMVFAVMFPIALLFRLGASERRARLRGLGALLASGAVAFGLAAFWVVPFLAHRDLHGPVVTWGTDPFDVRIAAILRGHLLFQPLVVKLVIVAWIVVLLRAATGHREHLVLVVVPALYLAIAHVTLSYPGPGDISLQLANRGLGYAGVIALFPVAALASLGARKAGEVSRNALAGFVVAAVLLLVAVGVTVGHSKENLAGEISPATPALRDAAVALRSMVPPGARFSMTRDYPAEIARVGVVEPARWLAWSSGVDTLNTFNPESSNAGAVAYTADGPDANQAIDDWIRKLQRLGVSDVVVDKPSIDNQMRRSPRARAVWSEGAITIYEVLTDSGTRPPTLIDPGTATPAVTFTQSNAERLRWDVTNPDPFTATIAVGWSPKWHARIDGRPARITKTAEGLMQIAVPGGHHTLRLSFLSDRADLLGRLLTLVTLGWLVSIPLRRRRGSRVRGGTGTSPHGPVTPDPGVAGPSESALEPIGRTAAGESS